MSSDQPAATKLQALFRGRAARNNAGAHQEVKRSAVKIQSMFRGHKTRNTAASLAAQADPMSGVVASPPSTKGPGPVCLHLAALVKHPLGGNPHVRQEELEVLESIAFSMNSYPILLQASSTTNTQLPGPSCPKTGHTVTKLSNASFASCLSEVLVLDAATISDRDGLAFPVGEVLSSPSGPPLSGIHCTALNNAEWVAHAFGAGTPAGSRVTPTTCNLLHTLILPPQAGKLVTFLEELAVWKPTALKQIIIGNWQMDRRSPSINQLKENLGSHHPDLPSVKSGLSLAEVITIWKACSALAVEVVHLHCEVMNRDDPQALHALLMASLNPGTHTCKMQLPGDPGQNPPLPPPPTGPPPPPVPTSAENARNSLLEAIRATRAPSAPPPPPPPPPVPKSDPPPPSGQGGKPFRETFPDLGPLGATPIIDVMPLPPVLQESQMEEMEAAGFSGFVPSVTSGGSTTQATGVPIYFKLRGRRYVGIHSTVALRYSALLRMLFADEELGEGSKSAGGGAPKNGTNNNNPIVPLNLATPVSHRAVQLAVLYLEHQAKFASFFTSPPGAAPPASSGDGAEEEADEMYLKQTKTDVLFREYYIQRTQEEGHKDKVAETAGGGGGPGGSAPDVATPTLYETKKAFENQLFLYTELLELATFLGIGTLKAFVRGQILRMSMNPRYDCVNWVKWTKEELNALTMKERIQTNCDRVTSGKDQLLKAFQAMKIAAAK